MTARATVIMTSERDRQAGGDVRTPRESDVEMERARPAAPVARRRFPALRHLRRLRRLRRPIADYALLIEGVGGVMVPLDQDNTVLDWIAELELPVILVAGSYLGSISHTLTAAEVLDQEDCDLHTIGVSETEGSHVPLYETVATIARFLPSVEVIALPRLEPGADHPAFAQIAKSCGLV